MQDRAIGGFVRAVRNRGIPRHLRSARAGELSPPIAQEQPLRSFVGTIPCYRSLPEEILRNSDLYC